MHRACRVVGIRDPGGSAMSPAASSIADAESTRAGGRRKGPRSKQTLADVYRGCQALTCFAPRQW